MRRPGIWGRPEMGLCVLHASFPTKIPYENPVSE